MDFTLSFDRGDGNYPLFEPSKNHSTAYKPKRSYASCFLKGILWFFKVPSEGKYRTCAGRCNLLILWQGKIKEQIESLSNINRTQKQLIGSLAHELKTPMTAIIGYADTLLTVRLTPGKAGEGSYLYWKWMSQAFRLSMKMLELTGLYEASEDSFNPAEIQVDNFLKGSKRTHWLQASRKKTSLLMYFVEPKELVKKFWIRT